MSRNSLYLFSLILLCLALVSCAITPKSIIVVSKVEDIPDITKIYQKSLSHLKVGMTTYQVNALFPELERECYASGICHFTVFIEQQIRLDQRLTDLNILSGSLISLLALTCALSSDTCGTALAAAVNVGIATSLEHKNITGDINSHSLVTLVQLINTNTIGMDGQTTTRSGHYSSAKPTGIMTLLQWINIEFDQGKVTSWAINEPLEQYKPKTFKNELPDLEDAL
ncbi:hypothetical protein [Psychrosphaera algicola]|uniref:Lipoprotein n=1 Tax=Psychrosphaera algicola TaxID=3023714 RepID=A0ABT5FI69_9GAMM|nr:hypothetical protein [Psychrosphaera sp. G1-22]MDC2890900.1 hypothetical protein [Psychrosphaera sp. G1-22]